MEAVLNNVDKKAGSALLNYFRYNLLGGLNTFPRREIRTCFVLFLIYVALAIPIGFGSGVIEPRLAEWHIFLYMPLALFVFPSLLEEAFFRGILIPRNTRDRGMGWVLFFSLLSSTVFVAWHPLNALTINPGASGIFFNPWFLLITFVLGMSCSLGYIYSRSLWVPVLMHWLTVLVWVLLLGGRNLLLE